MRSPSLVKEMLSFVLTTLVKITLKLIFFETLLHWKSKVTFTVFFIAFLEDNSLLYLKIIFKQFFCKSNLMVFHRVLRFPSIFFREIEFEFCTKFEIQEWFFSSIMKNLCVCLLYLLVRYCSFFLRLCIDCISSF